MTTNTSAIFVRLPPQLKLELKTAAVKLGMTLSEAVREAIARFADEVNNGSTGPTDTGA